MNSLVIAVVGLGNISIRHRNNLKAIFPNATVLAMSASGRALTEKVEGADECVDNMEQLIARKPRFAIVASPATLHCEHAISLLNAGIAVLIEKPLVVCEQQSEQLIRQAQLTKTPVAVAYCIRYLPSTIKMRQLLSEQAIGTLYNVFSNVGQYLPSWRPNKDYRQCVSVNKALGGGVLFELSHEFDFLQWLLGDLDYQHANLRHSKALNLEVEDIADVVLTNKHGLNCHIHLDFLQKSTQRQCSFIGQHGRIDWDLIENQITLHDENGSQTLFSEPQWDKNQMYCNMIKDFYQFIENEPNQVITLEEAATTVRLIQQIKENAIIRRQV